jgi:hypothetical protein
VVKTLDLLMHISVCNVVIGMANADAVMHFRYTQMQMVQSVRIGDNSMEHNGPGEASMWERVGVCCPFLFMAFRASLDCALSYLRLFLLLQSAVLLHPGFIALRLSVPV